MKKILSVLILTVTVAIGCSSSKATANEATAKKGEGLEFEYTAITRGRYRQINVTANGVALIEKPNATPTTVAISTTDWNALVDFYEKKVAKNVQNLNTIEVPSKKHQFDGALAATLTIKSGDTAYTTPTFDHGNPPAEVKVLVDKIIELAGIETRK